MFKGVPERARAHTFVVRDGLLLGLRLCSVGSFSCSAGRHLECLLLDVIRGFKGVPERGVDEDAAESGRAPPEHQEQVVAESLGEGVARAPGAAAESLA